jgi:gliding motility-associated-like protein/uncharacterized repeat protein (TIGR01451 family)
MLKPQSDCRSYSNALRFLNTFVKFKITCCLFLLLLSISGNSFAQIQATGGTGKYKNNIYWLDFAGLSLGTGGSKVFTFKVNGIDITAIVENVSFTDYSGGTLTGNYFIQPYISGVWTGDRLNYLYNIGGTGTKNTLVNAIRANVGGNIAKFRIRTYATINGAPADIGLVFANAESDDTTPPTSSSAEYTQGSTDGTQWKLLEKGTGTAANNNTNRNIYFSNNNLTAKLVCGENTALLYTQKSLTNAANPLTINAQFLSGGLTAMALGVMAYSEGSDAPVSYGPPSHTLSPLIDGGDNPNPSANQTRVVYLSNPTSPGVIINEGVVTKPATPKLGAISGDFDPASFPNLGTNADADNLNGENDEDGILNFPTLLISHSSYAVTAKVENSSGVNANLVGWIDFNRNGIFEQSEGVRVVVPNGATSATLTWTGLAGQLIEGKTYARFRISTSSGLTTATPSSVISNGEVEDYTLNITRSYDLGVTKVATPAIAKGGQPLVYTITLTNSDIGPNSVFPADIISLVDNLPAGFTATSYTPSAGTYTSANGNWTGLSLSPGQSATLTIFGTVSLATLGPLSNTVTVKVPPAIIDPVVSNNTATISTPINWDIDFNVLKTVDNTCADPASGNTYTINVSNQGTTASTTGQTLTITDVIPTGFTVSSAAGTGWTASNAGNSYTFKRTTSLAPGASFEPITIKVIPPAGGTNWVNTANLSYTGIGETTPANNNSSVTLYAKLSPPTVTTPVIYCQGATATALMSTGTTLKWYTVAVGGVGTATAPVPLTTTAGTQTYYVTQTNGSCESARAPIVVTVQAPLSNNAITVPAVNTFCSTGIPGTISGNTPSGGSGAYTYQWQSSTTSSSAGFTNISGATQSTYTPTVALNQTTYYQRIATSLIAGCGSLTSNVVTITVNPVITGNSITLTGSSQFCSSGDPGNITGSTPTGGSGTYIFSWEQSINGGTTWTPIAGATASNYDPMVVSVHTMYRRVISSGTCSSTSNVITVAIDQAPTVANAGTNIQHCNNPSFTMAANTPAIGTGTWTVVSGPAVIANTAAPTTGVTLAAGQTATLAWTIKNGTCASSIAQVVINNQALPTTANAGTYPTQYNSGVFTLNGNVPTSGTGVWTVKAGSTATIANPNAANTTVTIAANTSATLIWTISNGSCSASSAETIVTYTQAVALKVVKSMVTQGPFTAGQSIVYRIIASNNGPSDALGIKITDAVPADIVVSGINVSVGGNASIGQNTSSGNAINVTADIASGSGNTVTVDVNGTISANYSGTLTNTAIATSPNIPDPNGPASSVVTSPVTRNPVLNLVKTGPANVTAGDAITYQITISNTGTGNAIGTTMADVIPAQITGAAWTLSKTGAAVINGAVSGTGNNISFTGNIPAGTGNTIVINVTGTVLPSATGSFTNKATATPLETNVPVNSNTVITNISSKSGLVMLKNGPAAARAGAPVTYTLKINNTGLSDAMNASITDGVPAEIKNVSWTTATSGSASVISGGSGTGNTITLKGNIPTGGTNVITVTVTGTVDPSFSGLSTNTATATPSEVGSPASSSTVTTTVSRVPLVTIVKKGPTALTAGQSITYIIEATNLSIADAKALVITDAVSAQLSNVVWTTATTGTAGIIGSGNGTGNAISVTGNLPAGSGNKIIITVTGNVSSSFNGTLANNAIATPAEPGTIPGTSTVTTEVSRVPVLKIVKAGPATIIAGQQLIYTIEVSNTGTADALQTAIADAVPTTIKNVSWTAAVEGAATVNSGGSGTGNAVSLFANIPAGAANKITLTIKGTVDGAFSGSLVNVAEATPSEAGTTKVSSTVSTLASRTPVVTISKSGPANLIAGQNITYTITVNNFSTSDAKALVITDQVPATISDVSWSASRAGTAVLNGAASGTTNAISLNADLPAGSGNSVTITVTGKVSASLNGSLTNTATATPSEAGTVPQTATSTTLVSKTPILSIQKTGPATLSAGQQINYTITVNNSGTADAENATISDVVPSGVSGVTWSAIADPAGAAVITGASSGTGNSITLKANIPAGAANVIRVNIQGNVSAAATGVLVNTATVSPAEPGTTPKSAVVSTTLNAMPTISLVKTGPSEVFAGQTVTYTITASNSGPSDANGLSITDAVPTLLTNVSWMAVSTGTAAVTTGGIGSGNSVVVKGNISAGTGNTILVTITGQVPPGVAASTLSNTALATPAEPEVTPVNSNTITTTIKRVVNILAVKSASAAISAGEQITYTLKVTNNGPSDAQNLLIKDQLPAGINNINWTTAVTGTAAILSGATGTGSLVNLTANVPAGNVNSLLVTIIGTVDPGFTGSELVNTFTATPSEPGNPPVRSNETITPIDKTADLQVSKGAPTNAVAGQVINYTINVNNNGPSNVTNARIVDDVPATLTNVKWTATAQNGAAINSPATGTTNNIEVFAAIPAGHAGITINVSGTINAGFSGDLVNTATAKPETGITDPTPATSTATTAVKKIANVRIIKSGPADITAGEFITYSLRVVNDGPSNAPGVRIIDLLPVEVTGVSWTATATNGASVSSVGANGDVDVMADIPAGLSAAVNIIINGKVSPGATGAFTNTATANFLPGTEVTDPDLSSNTSSVTSKVNLDTELKVSKSGPSTINIGDRIDYRIEIKNGGASDIVGAAISDIVPNDVAVSSWVATASNGASVDGGLLVNGTTNTISATGDIPASIDGNESIIVINVTGTVKATAAATFTNTVTVTANGQKQSSVVTAVNQSTDVYIEKIGSQRVNAGAPVYYQLKIGNNGPVNVSGVSIADPIPVIVKNVTWSASAVGGATLTGAGGGSTNNLQTTANIPAGAGNYILIDIQGTIDPAATSGTVTNKATATLAVPGTTDFNTTNNTSEITTGIISKSGISVIKSGPATALSGTEITYTVTVVNAGPSNAIGAKIIDAVPAMLTNVSWTATATGNALIKDDTGTGSGNAVQVISDLPAGAGNVITLTIKGKIDPAYTGSITNNATVTPAESGNDPVTSDQVVTQVTNKSGLRIVKSGPSVIDAGKTVQYTLQVNNGGPGNAVNAVIRDEVPAGLTNIRWTAVAIDGAELKSDASGTINPVELKVNVPAGVGLVTVTILGDVPANSAGGTLVNTASIQPAEPGNPNLISNQITTAIVKNVNLTLTKSAPATLNAGEEITYTLAMTNTGPSDATAAKLNDPIPSGITDVSWSSMATGGAAITSGATGSGNSLDLVANIPVNATILVIIKGKTAPTFKGTLSNTAVLTPSEPGETPVSATATTEVKNLTNLIIIKSGTLNAVAGQVMSYQIKVSNSGPSTATNALITDAIPVQLEQVSWKAVAAGTAVITEGANGTGNTLSLKATLPAGQANEITIDISGKVSAAYGGNISNSATVTPSDPDNPAITTPPVITVVTQKPVISLNKTGPATAIAGGKISYTINVGNTGLSDAINLLIGDEVPSQVKNVSWKAVSSGSSAINGATDGMGNLVSINANIPTGSANEIIITITGTVDPSFAGTLLNKATATPSEPGNPVITTPVVQTVVTQSPLIVVNKTGQSGVIAGAAINYVIEVNNTGLSDATNLIITDQIDAAITGVSWKATTSGNSIINGTATGTGNAISLNANIPAGTGNKISITVTGTVNPAAEGKIVNTAKAVPSEPGNPPVVSPPVETNVTKNPVLVVTKTGQNTAIAGGAVTYTIAVTNTGLSDAKGISVIDAIPDKISGITWKATATGTATVLSGGTGTGNQLLVTGNIPAGSGANKITIVINGTVDPSFTGTLSNIATGSIPDINVPTTITPPAETEVGATPGVVIKKNGPATAIAGAEITYTITAGNTGLSNAKNLLITDQVPVSLSNVSWTTNATGTAAVNSGATGSGNVISVNADIPAGVTQTVIITVKGTIAASYNGNLTNTAVATPSEPNTVPVNSNNTIVVSKIPVLAILKSGPATLSAGQEIAYTIEVNNTGTSDAANASITDAVPVNISAVSWQAIAKGTANILSGANGNGNNVNINANIPAGSGNTILVTVKGIVNASATADVVNIATVTPSEHGSIATSSTLTTKLIATPKISLVKIGPSEISAGMPITYTLTTGNSGPSDARNLAITDVVPAELDNVSWTTTITGSASVLTGLTGTGHNVLVNGNIPAGSGNTIVVTITGTVPASTADGVVINNIAIAKPAEQGIPQVPSNPVPTKVNHKVNIRAVKSAPSAISAGENMTYTLQVFNDGPGDATNLAIQDAVNSDIKNVNWTTTTTGTANVVENGTGAGNAVNLKVNIPAGAANAVTVLITGQVDPAFTGASISNTFIATPSEPNNPAVPSTPVVTEVIKTADIQIQKSGTSTAVAGSAIAYTLIVKNAGPSNASAVKIVDQVPPDIIGVTWTAVAQNGAVLSGPANGPGNVNLTAAIPAGAASVVITINGQIDPGYPGLSLINTATAVPEPGVIDPTPGISTVITNTSRVANVRIIKSGPANIGAGETITYQLRVVNDGPSTAVGVVIKDVLPVNLEPNATWTAVGLNGANVNLTNGTGDVNLIGNIPSGVGEINVTITGKVKSDNLDGTTFINEATAYFPPGSPITDPDLSSNSSKVNTVVNNDPVLKVSKSGPATVNIGDPINYTIVIRNGGAGNITNADITDQVPDDVAVSSWTIVSGGGASVLGGIIGGTTNLVNAKADIPADGNAATAITINIQGTVKTTAAAIFTNTVTVVANGTRQSSVVTAVNRSTDIKVEKSGPQSIAAGSAITYTVKVSNGGPVDVVGLVLNDAVPAQVAQVNWKAQAFGAASITGALTGSTNAVHTNVAIPVGEANYILVTVNGTVKAAALAGSMTNTASVQMPAGISDFNLANNTSSVVTAINAVSGLEISKTGPQDGVTGSTITYTIKVVNNGPSDASQAAIRDLVPAGVNNVSWIATTSGAAVINAGATGKGNIVLVNANVPSGPGNIVTITISGTIDPGLTSPLINTATVTPSEPGNPPVTSGEVVTKIINKSGVKLVKSGPSSVEAGTAISYKLELTNTGPGNAMNIAIKDIVPAALTNVSWTAIAANGAVIRSGVVGTGNQVNLTADLPAGNAKVTVTINALVFASTIATSVDNTATATPAEPGNPPVTSNTITTAIVNNVNLSFVKSGPSNANSGEMITYTLAVGNSGPSDAKGVNLQDLVPSQITGITWSSAVSGNAVISSGATGNVNNVQLTADIPANGSILVTVTGKIDPSFTGPLTNKAVLTPAGKPVINAEVTTTVKNLSALKITKSGSGVATSGLVMKYQIVVSNSGPGTAQNAVITDVIPVSLTQVSWTAVKSGTAVISSGVTGTGNNLNVVATVPPGQGNNVTIDITGIIDPSFAGKTSNTATVTPQEPGNPPVTTPPVETLVSKKTNVLITKKGPATITAGDQITYVIEVSNTGPSNAANLVVTDGLPLQIGNVKWTTSISGTAKITAGATGEGNAVQVTADVAANGNDKVTITITGKVNAALEGTLSNIATATPSEPGNPAVVTPPVETVVKRIPMVTLVKTGQAMLKSGDMITYTVDVTNSSLSDALALTITDLISSDISGIKWTTTATGNAKVLNGGTGNSNNMNVAVDLPSGDGNKISITITGMIPKVFVGKILNTARAISAEGVPEVLSNTIETIVGVADFIIPNIITPNNDGNNDTFKIKGMENYPGSQVLVFNRWGNEVYRSNDYRNDWDGSQLNEGTYYYIISRKEQSGNPTVFKGWLFIKR